MLEAVRLAFGTLSVLPVGHPQKVSGRTWGQALALAPLVGLVLGGIAWAVAFGVAEAGGAPALGAVMGVAALAALTRGLHLDGLADVADGLGSWRPPEHAREVMKRSDIGPFGVVTVLLVVLAQVASLEQVLWAPNKGLSAVTLIGAAVVSRASLAMTCRSGVSAATPDGLGAQVAESLSPASTIVIAAATMALVTGAAALTAVDAVTPVAISTGVALGVAETWRRHCSRRLGGVTGDVLGSVEQVAFTAFLVTLVLLLP
ncbi:MAG: adenosylcobinamide-GDP ribazoletransferase [Actinomycetia bacterium]|nr:adenosylcobinamide-GDP ribazoletransferase [Actinomycetes bacterium]